MKPNSIFFSRKLKDRLPHVAREIESKLRDNNITPKWLDMTYDIWARDYMPLQVDKDVFLHYYYYPDYLLKTLEDRASITNPIRLEQAILMANGKHVESLPLILDGGNVVMTDKNVILTDKVLEENKRISKDAVQEVVETMLREAFKSEPILVKWEKSTEPFGHIDWLVRYIGGKDNLIIVGFNEKSTMATAEDAYKKLCEAAHYRVEKFQLTNPNEKKSWAYLNYVQVENVILMPTVADKGNDEEAINLLQNFYDEAGMDVKIEAIDCQDLIELGGALHCISWNPYLD